MKCNIPTKHLVNKATKEAVDGIIDILFRAYAEYCRTRINEGRAYLNFEVWLTDVKDNMTAEEFSTIPLMSKAEYYGDE